MIDPPSRRTGACEVDQQVRAAHIDAKQLIEVRFICRGERSDAGVDKEDVNTAALAADEINQCLCRLRVAGVRDDGLHIGHCLAHCANATVARTRHDDRGPLLMEELGGGGAHAAHATVMSATLSFKEFIGRSTNMVM